MTGNLFTARLSMRRPTAADVPAILAIHSDERACAYNPSDRLVSEADAIDLYHRWDEHWQHHGFGYWVLRMHGDTRIIGFCGVKVMQLHVREVLNLFYRLDPATWGRGLATEAAVAVARWAASDASRWPLIARVRPANTASIRVAEHVGLQRAERLDTVGEDGPDLIYTARWPVECGRAGPTGAGVARRVNTLGVVATPPVLWTSGNICPTRHGQATRVGEWTSTARNRGCDMTTTHNSAALQDIRETIDKAAGKVFGEPIQRDDMTVLPVAAVATGGGGGGGSRPARGTKTPRRRPARAVDSG